MSSPSTRSCHQPESTIPAPDISIHLRDDACDCCERLYVTNYLYDHDVPVLAFCRECFEDMYIKNTLTILRRACNIRPLDTQARAVYADYLEDCGLSNQAAVVRYMGERYQVQKFNIEALDNVTLGPNTSHRDLRKHWSNTIPF